jgi:hypothetical protein
MGAIRAAGVGHGDDGLHDRPHGHPRLLPAGAAHRGAGNASADSEVWFGGRLVTRSGRGGGGWRCACGRADAAVRKCLCVAAQMLMRGRCADAALCRCFRGLRGCCGVPMSMRYCAEVSMMLRGRCADAAAGGVESGGHRDAVAGAPVPPEPQPARPLVCGKADPLLGD